MNILRSKLTYIIIFMLMVNIVLILFILKGSNKNSQDMSIDFFVSGDSQNMSCLALYVNDDYDGNEYSFDNGKTWQKSNYGAIYQNGKTTILVRNSDKKTIFEKELNINYLVSNGPVIKMSFDYTTTSKTTNSLLKGVTATIDGKDITSNIEASVEENNDNNVIVSYLIENNGKKCYLLRDITIDNKGKETTPASDKWLWPTQKPYKISKLYGKYNGKLHSGVDIYGLKRGSPIYAARAGDVIAITSNSSSGYYVILKHDNGYYTRYAHMQNVNGNDKLNSTGIATKYINVGDRVEAGDVIGEIGSSGHSTGLHLHFEIWDGMPFKAQSYDPLKFY